MPTITATIVLGKNGLTTTDLTAANTEYVIDDCIDYINGRLKTQYIPSMTGASGTKAVTVTYDMNAALNPLITIVMREVKKTSLTNSGTTGSTSTSQSIGVGGLNVSQSSAVSSAVSMASVINNPANTPEVMMFEQALAVLKEEIAGELEAELA